MNTITKSSRPAVSLGAGSGPEAFLEFAKLYWQVIISIHSVYDSGGSSANFRKRGHGALGDIRRGIVALATRTERNAAMYDFMSTPGRFKTIAGSPYNNDAGGNFMLALLSEMYGTKHNAYDLIKAIRMIEICLGNTSRVMPISLDKAHILTHFYGLSKLPCWSR